MAIFIEKSPVTSSHCYKTIKTASIQNKLGKNVDLTVDFVTTCSVLNFQLPWQRGDISKLPYDRSGVIFSLSQVQTYLGDKSDCRPFNPPKQKGEHTPSVMCILDRGRAEKVVTFLNNIFQIKTNVGGLNKEFFTI
jgi:hypothetical protein